MQVIVQRAHLPAIPTWMEVHTSLDRRAALVQNFRGRFRPSPFASTPPSGCRQAVATNIERARSAFAGLGWRKAEMFVHVREITDSG